MYMCANKEEIRATDFFSFPPNSLKLLLYAWAQRTGLQLKNWKQMWMNECGVHYLLFFQTWYFSVQYFYFTLLLYQRLGQPLNLRSICMTAFNLKKSGHLILQTKRKYRNVLNYWSLYCPHKMQLCRQWQQQTNRQNAARRINNCNFSIVSEQRVRVGVQIRFARQISPVLRANIFSAVLINLGHYLQPLQMLFCHIVYLDHPFVSGL